MTRRLSRIPFTHRGCATPKLAIIGGRLEDDNDAIYDEMRRLAGGRIVVFATASSEPDEVGPETIEVFRAHGLDAVQAEVHGPGRGPRRTRRSPISSRTTAAFISPAATRP